MNGFDLGYAALGVATWPWWRRRARGGWAERFGRVLPELPSKQQGKPRVLLHAVSVGETASLRTLVPMLVDRGAEVIVTATTDTGLARAHELYDGVAHVCRFPLDGSWIVRKFLDAVQPDVVGLVELEVWPNFVAACAQRRIPVGVISGRLSERSFRGYRRAKPIVGRAFRQLAFASAQDEAYCERFRAMGCSEVTVDGSMKFDAVRISDEHAGSDELARELGIDAARPIVVGASTGPGEEALLHEVCPAGVQLLCAPRRAERFDEAAAAMPGCVRRSARKTGSGERFLLDSIGELSTAFGFADVVVMGRSFPEPGARRALGGSDPIEPIAKGCAVVCGPDMTNFRDVVGGFADVGAVRRSDRESLGSDLANLVANGRERTSMVEAGRGYIRQQHGASQHCADLLLSHARNSQRD